MHSSRKFLRMFLRSSEFGLVLIFAVFLAACSKVSNSNEVATNKNAANSNQQDQASTPPLQQSTITGDIERISFAISTVRELVKNDRWQDAHSQLQSARKQVDAALARQSNLAAELQALKDAIDRAMPAVESRGKEAESRVAELQTRIGTIKVMNSN